MTIRRLLPTLRRALVPTLLVALVAGAVVVRPGSGHNPFAHVVIAGTSMEPTLRGGDFAVLRRRASYARGDVVAYRIPAGEPGAGTMVVHRIVGRAGGRLVLKGDGERSRDPWQPATSDVVGEVVLRVPRLGAAIAALRGPAGLAGAAGLVAFLVALGSAQPPRPREQEPEAATEVAPPPVVAVAAARPVARPSATPLLVGGSLLLGAALLVVLLRARPVTR